MMTFNPAYHHIPPQHHQPMTITIIITCTGQDSTGHLLNSLDEQLLRITAYLPASKVMIEELKKLTFLDHALTEV